MIETIIMATIKDNKKGAGFSIKRSKETLIEKKQLFCISLCENLLINHHC